MKVNLCVITKVTYPYFVAILRFTVFRNMAQNYSTGLARPWKEKRGKLAPLLANFRFKWELDLYLLKGFSWNRAFLSVLQTAGCSYLMKFFGLFDWVKMGSNSNWNEGRTFATWSSMTILWLKPGLTVGQPFYFYHCSVNLV